MVFKRSFAIFTSNVTLMFKVLIYTMVLMLICMGVIIAVLNPILNEAFMNFNLGEQLNGTVKRWLEGDMRSFNIFFNGLGSLFTNKTIFKTVLSFVLFWVLLKFFTSLTFVPIAKVVNNRMSRGYKEKFYSALIASLGKSLFFSLLFTLITAPLDMVIMAGGYFLLKILYSGFSIVSLSITILIMLFLFALRLTIFSQWVPYIVCEEMSVINALKRSFTRSFRQITSILPSMLMYVIMLFTIIMTTSVTTFFIAPVIAMAGYIILINTCNLIVYYSSHSQKFYVDEKTVEMPEKD